MIADLYGQDETLTYAVLSDDLVDIYIDLQEGLLGYRQEFVDAAIEHWTITFKTHWGMHLVNSLKALQALLTLRDVA